MDRNLGILLFLNFMTGVTMSLYAVFFPLVGENLNVTEVVTGTSLSIGRISGVLILLYIGTLVEKSRKDRWFLLIGFIGQSISFFLLFLITVPWLMFIISALQRSTLAIANGFLLARITFFAGNRKIGSRVSSYALSSTLGMTFGSTLGGFLIDLVGLTITYLYVSGIIIVALGSIFGYKAPPMNPTQATKPASREIGENTPSRRKFPRPYYHLLGSVIIHGLGFSLFFSFFALFIVWLGGTPLIIGLADGSMNLTSLIFIPIMGIIVDRKNAKVVTMIAFWGDIIIFTSLLFTSNLIWVIPLMIAKGVTSAAVFTGVFSLVPSLVNQNKGIAVVTISTAVSFGMIFSPLIGGFLLSISDFTAVIFVTCIAMVVAAIWATIKVPNQTAPKLSLENNMEKV